MKDTIYRQAAIDELNYADDMGTIRSILDVLDVIRKLPSAQPEDYAHGFADGYAQGKKDAQPEPKWIPCSERLPENGHYYLWCSDMGSVQSDYYWNGFENGMKYGYNIIAWMPLPEPYKEGQDEKT